MGVLSNEIENFIKSMFEEGDKEADLQRNELADYFGCAPSQINYVLSTRFSPENGYIIESRRGGGGYIRVIKINIDENDYITNLINKTLSGRISFREAVRISEGLYQTGIIDENGKKIINAALSDKAINVPAGIKDSIRANILKQILLALIS